MNKFNIIEQEFYDMRSQRDDARQKTIEQELQINKQDARIAELNSALAKIGLIATFARIDESQYELGQRLAGICKVYRSTLEVAK
jgi:hypothetical protein